MQRTSKDLKILAVLLLITAVFRLWTLMMIHTGIDERDYWYSAKSLSQGLEYPYVNHRTIRWSVILPVAAAQLITGVHPNAYYFTPVLNSLAQTALLFFLGFRLFNRKTAIIASLCMIFFPYQIRAASQIRPEIFSITYILALLWFFTDYWTGDGAKARRGLILSSVMLYVAYHAKITNLFFLPGMLVLIAMNQKNTPRKALADMAVFGGICLGAFLIETLLYGLLLGFPLGHLQIIANNHVGGLDTLGSWTELFNRYVSPYLQAYWQVPFALFLVCAIDGLAGKRQRMLPLVIVPALSFFLFITVAISGVHPLKAAEPFTNRYFSAVLPLVFLCLGWYASYLADTALAGASPLRRRLRRAFVPVSLAGTALFIAAYSIPSDKLPLSGYFAAPFSRNHPFYLNERYRAVLNASWDQGLAIVGADSHEGENAIGTAAWYYLDIARYGARRAPSGIVRSGSRQSVTYISLGGRDPENADRFVNVVRKPFRMAILPIERLPAIEGETFDKNALIVR